MLKILTFAGIFLPFFMYAQIYQWRGIERDGIYNETGLLKEWPVDGPKLIFQTEKIGKGWSSAVIVNDTTYITGMIDTSDVISAIDANGNIIWQTTYGRSWEQSFPDTRSTPTIENNKIYLSSGSGEVVCLNAQSGEIAWKNNVFKNNKGECGRWGIAESILIVDDKVVFTTGGQETMMIAFDKISGEIVWKTKSLQDFIGYVSPILIEHNNHQQIVGLSAHILFGIDPENGNIVWNYDYSKIDEADWGDNGAIINCTSPIFKNGELYVTSGYNHTGAKFKLKDDLSDVEFLWKDEELDNHHGGIVLIDGYLYGSNWITNGTGNWCCINWETGEKKYEEKFDNKGSIIYADNMLYVYTEKQGKVGLVKVNPEKFELISEFKITEGDGPHWAHPSINNGKLYIRHGDVLMVYNIKEHSITP